MNFYAQMHGIAVADLDVAPNVVVAWSGGVASRLARATGATQPKEWLYGSRLPHYRGSFRGTSVGMVRAPVGAPGTVMLMEEMVACGARRFLGVGLAGSLQRDAGLGAILLATSAISEEGTSRHYASAKSPRADPTLLARLARAAHSEGVAPIRGRIWTTDAPYREHESSIRGHAKRGVVGVDMETAAMYALGRFRGVQVANALVVSDELWAQWNPGFHTTLVEQSRRRAERIALRALSLKR